MGIIIISVTATTAAAAKSLQLCPTLCDPIDGSPPGSSVHGILQARTLEWGAIAFSHYSYCHSTKMISGILNFRTYGPSQCGNALGFQNLGLRHLRTPLRGTLGSSLRSPAEGEGNEGFPPPPDKDLESPSSTRLEALVSYIRLFATP